MSSQTGQILPFPDVDVELSIIWGQRRIRMGDVYEIAQTLASEGSAVANLDNSAQSALELRVGEITIGYAQLVGTHPVRLEITELFGETGLVRQDPTPQTDAPATDIAE